MSDVERIATLEANERNMARELKAIHMSLTAMTVNMVAVNKTLSEMSGGKKAVMGMFALIGGLIGVFGTMFAMFAIHPIGKS
jgi:uncharacterized protein YqgC (DUF456 family)